jgi:fibronectin-binding autotransporter adhesin
VNLGIGTGGTVTVGTNTAGGVGGIAIANNSTLAAGVSGLVLTNRITTLANGIINQGTGTFTLNGLVEGAGSISTINTGNLILNGSNSFVNLGIGTGGTVTVGTNTAGGVGGIAIANNSTLAAGVSGLVLTNRITTLGNGIIDQGTGTFTLNGLIEGAGSISTINIGNLILNGDNVFTNLGIGTGGTVTVGTNTAAGLGGIVIANNATLAAGVSGLVLTNQITTLGNGIINSGSGVFTLNGRIDGAGGINKTGSGLLILGGDNVFSGGLTISGGNVVQLGQNTSGGTGAIVIADNGTLQNSNNLVLANDIVTLGNGLIDQGAAGNIFTLNGPISGAGSISTVNTGNLVLNGNNVFTNLGIGAGTVTVGTNTAAGVGGIAIASGSTLAAGVSGLTLTNRVTTLGNGIIDQGTGTFTLAGLIEGAGSLTTIGTGILNLAGANAYTGGTFLNSGTIGFSTNTSMGTGTITINAGTLLANANNLNLANILVFAGPGTIDTAANALTVSGVVSGIGRLTKAGAGNLTLAGANTFTGGMTIAAGTVTGATANLGSGGILNNGALVINQPTDATFSQIISGTGSVTKGGAGVLTLSAVNTVSGPTTVAMGRLNVTGSLANSAVTVQSGASLSGTGAVGALTALSGSTITPGNSVGTIAVNGALTLAAGSTYLVDVTATGADRLSATGPASIAGNLVVTPGAGSFTSFNQSYTLVSSSARTGTFATTTLGNFGAAFAPTLVYDATSVILRLAPGSLVAAGGSQLSGNALAVANSFDTAVRGGYNPQPFFALYTQGANLPVALSQLSGELRSAERRVLLEDTRVVREAAFDRLNSGLAAVAGSQSVTSETGDGKALTFWLRGAGSWGTADGDAVGSRFTTEQTGFLTGLDYAVNDFKIGGMFHYTRTNVEFATLGRSRVESIGGALYAGYRHPDAGLAVGLGGSIAGNNTDGSRAITAPGLQQSLAGRVDGSTYQIFAEAAFDLVKAANTRVEPFGRVAFARVNSDAFAETGGIAAVNGTKQGSDLTLTTLGLRGAIVTGMATLSGSAGWARTSGDRSAATLLSITGPNTPFVVNAAALDRDAVALEAQASFNLSQKITLGVGYSGLIGSNNSDHGARATLTIGF